MKDTPTPRTDAKYESICESWEHQISDLPKMTEFARQLERELTAVTEQRDKLAELSGFGEFDKLTEPWADIANTADAVKI